LQRPITTAALPSRCRRRHGTLLIHARHLRCVACAAASTSIPLRRMSRRRRDIICTGDHVELSVMPSMHACSRTRTPCRRWIRAAVFVLETTHRARAANPGSKDSRLTRSCAGSLCCDGRTLVSRISVAYLRPDACQLNDPQRQFANRTGTRSASSLAFDCSAFGSALVALRRPSVGRVSIQ
jgi:hypothetical protein